MGESSIGRPDMGPVSRKERTVNVEHEVWLRIYQEASREYTHLTPGERAELGAAAFRDAFPKASREAKAEKAAMWIVSGKRALLNAIQFAHGALADACFTEDWDADAVRPILDMLETEMTKHAVAFTPYIAGVDTPWM